MTVKIPSSAFIKNLIKRTKLIQHYEKAWAGIDEPFTFTYTPKENDDAFHPSGDCTPTPGELYLKAVAKMEGEILDPISPTLRKTFLIGHYYHAIYQKLTVDMGFAKPEHIERVKTLVWSEERYPKKSAKGPRALPYHWARGSADIAPCEVPRYGSYLIDYKTMNSMSFNRIQPPNYADKWECQLNIYMKWFNLEKALIVGINKDTQELKEFEYRYNEDLVEHILDKWKFVSECIDLQERPTEDDNRHFDLTHLLQGPIES